MFTLTIQTANAAFSDDDGGPEYEIARLLRAAADDVIEGARTSSPIFDVNGNTVGEWRLARKKVPISDSAALDAIAGLMDGAEWDADTTERVAEIVRQSGREVGDPT